VSGFNVKGIVSLQDAFSAVAKRVGTSAQALQTKLAGVSASTKAATAAAATGPMIMGFKATSVAAAGIGFGIYKAVSLAMDLEDSMADVRKVMNLTKGDTIALSNELLDLSKSTTTSAKGLADIAAAGGQLGIGREDIVQFTDGINKLSVAFDMTASDAGNTFAKIKNALGLTLDETFSLGDAMNQLSNNTAASASEIASALPVFGATAKAMGMAGTEAAALATTLIEAGRAPSMVGRGLNNILMTLGSISTGTVPARKAIKGLGFSLKELQAEATVNPINALLNVLKKLSALPIAERMGPIKDIFGQQWADEIVILSNNIGKFRSNLELIDVKSKFDGSALEEYANRMDTTSARFSVLGNRIVAIGSKLGAALLPALNIIVSGVELAIKAFEKLYSIIAGIGSSVGSLFGGIGSALSGMFSGIPGLADIKAQQQQTNLSMGQPFNTNNANSQDVKVSGTVVVKNEQGVKLGTAPINQVGKNGAGALNSNEVYGY
jgi:TP901 family phage tail tape measure protein